MTNVTESQFRTAIEYFARRDTSFMLPATQHRLPELLATLDTIRSSVMVTHPLFQNETWLCEWVWLPKEPSLPWGYGTPPHFDARGDHKLFDLLTVKAQQIGRARLATQIARLIAINFRFVSQGVSLFFRYRDIGMVQPSNATVSSVTKQLIDIDTLGSQNPGPHGSSLNPVMGIVMGRLLRSQHAQSHSDIGDRGRLIMLWMVRVYHELKLIDDAKESYTKEKRTASIHNGVAFVMIHVNRDGDAIKNPYPTNEPARDSYKPPRDIMAEWLREVDMADEEPYYIDAVRELRTTLGLPKTVAHEREVALKEKGVTWI